MEIPRARFSSKVCGRSGEGICKDVEDVDDVKDSKDLSLDPSSSFPLTRVRGRYKARGGGEG